jgi:hypothetical protein
LGTAVNAGAVETKGPAIIEPDMEDEEEATIAEDPADDDMVIGSKD